MTSFITFVIVGRLQHLLKDFCRNAQANIVLMAAIMIPVLLTAVGIAIDITRYLKTSNYVQTMVDQAALAALAVDGENREQIVHRFFKANLDPEIMDYIRLNTIKVEESVPGGGSLSVRVSADVSMRNIFGRFIGIGESNIAKSGLVVREKNNVEAVMTLSSSGTMCALKSRLKNTLGYVSSDTLISLEPDDNCIDFNAMKQGVRHFVDIIQRSGTTINIKLGLVPYNHKVKMPNLAHIPPSLRTNEEEGYYENVSDAEPLAPVMPLTSNLNAVRKAVDRMQQSPDGMAWTRSDLSSHVAALMLHPDSHRYFGGLLPKPMDDPKTQKILIMMADGASNVGCCFTNWPAGNYNNQYVYFYKPYSDAQLEICRILKENNVKIYSILFDVQITDTGGRETHDVFSRCASPYGREATDKPATDGVALSCSERQNCYNITSTDQLRRVYADIAQSFLISKIAE